VVLRFDPHAAIDAAGWVFHPSQSVERGADSSLIVRFHAGGVQEMCWHLFTWGTAVRVVSPPELRLALEAMAADVSAHHLQSTEGLGNQEGSTLLVGCG